MAPTVQPEALTGDTIFRDVTKLEVDDVIAAPWLPLRRPGRVLLVKPFERPCLNHGPVERWVFVAYVTDTGEHDGTSFLASEGVRLVYAADPTGITYGRGDEGIDPQQIGKRVPPHFESGREFCDRLDECTRELGHSGPCSEDG